jgi:hypothetical protein
VATIREREQMIWSQNLESGPDSGSDDVLRPFLGSLPLKGLAVDTFVASSWLVTGGPRPEVSRGKARRHNIIFHSLY